MVLGVHRHPLADLGSLAVRDVRVGYESRVRADVRAVLEAQLAVAHDEPDAPVDDSAATEEDAPLTAGFDPLRREQHGTAPEPDRPRVRAEYSRR